METEGIYDVQAIRAEFPILSRKVKGKDLVYLDNAATSQKPTAVIDALVHYYSHYNANIHRGLHTLADEATAAYEASRVAVMHFVGASSPDEIIFTKGTTESINLVANAWGKSFLQEGDEIIKPSSGLFPLMTTAFLTWRHSSQCWDPKRNSYP